MADRPPALSPEALAALTAYRDATPMPQAVRERVHARLSEAAPARPVWRWVGVGAIAAALLLWGALGVSDALRARADTSSDGNQAPMQVPQDSGETAAVTPAEAAKPKARRSTTPLPSAQPPAQPSSPLPPAPLEALETTRPAAVPEPAPRAAPRRKTTPAPPPAATPAPLSASRLSAENRLIAQTWEHVRAKQYAKARQVLNTHASEFPSGVLAPERRALLVIVGCLQHPGSASGKADAYAATGRSTLLTKVRSACDPEKTTEK